MNASLCNAGSSEWLFETHSDDRLGRLVGPERRAGQAPLFLTCVEHWPVHREANGAQPDASRFFSWCA
jgi:hypothetical protein